MGIVVAGNDLDEAAGTHTGGTGLDHCDNIVTFQDAVGCLDQHIFTRNAFHQLNVLDGCSAVAHAGGGLNKFCAGFPGYNAGSDLFIPGEVAGLNDHLDLSFACRGIHNGLDILIYLVIVLIAKGTSCSISFIFDGIR